MGTSIVCFFAHDVDMPAGAWQDRLNEMSAAHSADLREIQTRSHRFSKYAGVWSVNDGTRDEADPSYLYGEGPSGLSITAYKRVVNLGSSERFAALYDETYRVAVPLRRLLCAFATSLANPARIAVAAAGFGDTDVAEGVAYEGGSFENVCEELTKVVGAAAPTWRELDAGELVWYLGPPILE